MQDNSHDQVLDTIERYFGIRETDAEELVEALDSVDVAGGDWLFRQGDLADALYFLVRGRLQVWVAPEIRRGETDAKLLGEITPGESVGEIGLLTGGVRTAGIRAIRDSRLLRMDRQAFEHFAGRHPNLVMQLAGGVARRLTERTRPGSSTSRNLGTVALVPLSHGPWFPGFCERLTADLGKRVSTLCLSAGNLGRYGAPVDALNPGDDIPDALRRWLDRCESEHRLLIYVADAGDTAWSRLAIRQADMILLLADASDEPAPSHWETRLLDSEGATTARRALILRHPARDAVITGTARWLDARDTEFHLHLRGDSEAETGRIVRLLMGNSVGLVLGGGAARGFAEVGAYRAMHEAGVPVDWIGGTSIGGIIGAAIALDEGPDYVIENSRKAFVEGKPFGDYTLPLVSLIKGRRMERLTRHHLRGNIEDLPIPFFCVSALLDTGELRVEERGPIWRALRATAALPGLMPPAVMDQRLVVDGSVVNNLPIDIMRSKPVGRVVAVDVTTRRTYQVDYDELPSSWSVFGSRVVPWRKRHRVPGVISVLMKSAEIGTAARVREMAASADLLIRPPVSGFSLTDVNSFDRIVAAGYDHAREQFSKWMSTDERMTPRHTE